MAEVSAMRKKSKPKERAKVIVGDIPGLPDNDIIEIKDQEVTQVDEEEDTMCVPKDEFVSLAPEMKKEEEVEVQEIKKVETEEVQEVKKVETKVVQEVKNVGEVVPTTKPIEIARLYPSIRLSFFSSENEDCVRSLDGEKECLDMVAEVVRKAPEAPILEWELPAPMPEKEFTRYYENVVLDGLEEMETDFLREMGPQIHPLVDLLDRWQRSVNVMWQMKERMKVERDLCGAKAKDLWKVVEKNGVREGKCKDNGMVRKTYVYDEATYDEAGGKLLRQNLRKVSDQVMEDLCVAQYECAVSRAQVDNCLVRVRSQVHQGHQGTMAEVRTCIAIILQFLRRPQSQASCRKSLQDWTVYLGSAIAASGHYNDKLYLLWQLLHAPSGVGEWGAALVQPSVGDDRDMDLSVAYLAMILASGKHREHFLAAFSPESVNTLEDDSAWTLVDSDGEEDGNVASCWSLLRESDLTAFLTQVPIKAIFKAALDIDPHGDDGSDEITASRYDPGRSCHPGILLRLMAFVSRIIGILSRGFDQHDFARYKTFNKRISRLLKHTIQFLTDHLEIVLGTSMIPPFMDYFPDEARLLMLAQYESVFESALVSLLIHRRHGNWQSLADLPWRMLSPYRKELLLYRLIDPVLGVPPTHLDQMVSAFQSTLEAAQHGEAIYLLTALGNLALECRTLVATEHRLLTTITNLLFQICYVVPATRASFSKVGRELLSSICLQHPQALSVILDAVKLWHPSLGQMGLFLFRELPFCLMIPNDSEFKILASWILENPPASLCNQLARHILTNLNWGFANTDETILYLPLSLHQKMADIIVHSFRKHTIESKSGQWMLDSMKLVTSLWWNQESLQEQSFHSWCLGLVIRLRLHPASRPRVFDQNSLQSSGCINTSDWIQAMTDAQQEKCTNPVAMFVSITCVDSRVPELMYLKVIQNLMCRHQQYRLCLELIGSILSMSTSSELNCLVGNDLFMGLWRQMTHADDTYYNMVKNMITKQFPGSVLSCIGNSFSASLIIGQNDPDRQETMMRFFIRSVLYQVNWVTDHCFLWLLNHLLDINSSLDLKAGSQEMYLINKSFTDKQLQDASKRSGLANIFRLGSTFTPLLTQVPVGDYLWVKSYILEAQAKLEDETKIWPVFLYKIFVRKKKDSRTVTSAMTSACKHLKLPLTFSVSCLVIIQAAQTIATCPPEHFAMIKLASVFFPRYLGMARTWDQSLAMYGSSGHVIFQDDACLSILQQARTAITAAKVHVSATLDSMQQTQDTDLAKQSQLQRMRDSFDTFLLWIDEPRLHLVGFPIGGLPAQYRADLLEKVRFGDISSEELSLPRRLMLNNVRSGASLWTARHDLDMRFVRLAEMTLRKAPVPIATRLFQRFNRQTSFEALTEPSLNLYMAPTIPLQAMVSSTHMLEFISGFLSTMYQCAAKFKANKNFLSDLDKRYLVALSRYYEPSPVNQAFQMPCSRGQHCTGMATITLNYQTWTSRPDVVTEVTRNRQEYNSLVDEVVDFVNLDQLVKAVVCLQTLIMSLDSHLRQCKSEEDTKKVVECGMTLFFHLGRQINKETQMYPPHRHMVSSSMESLGSSFVQYATNQAHKLLQGMLDNELLVEVYGPHFNPNLDDTNTAKMYSQIVAAYREGKIQSHVTFVILNKFNMTQFMDHSPRLASRLSMVVTLCDSLSSLKSEDPKVATISSIHVENLQVLLVENYSKCLAVVLERFLKMCQETKLEPQFWQVLIKCAEENIKRHGELSLTIDEIKKELETYGCWLNSARFSDPVAHKDGLYIKYGRHATQLTKVYGLLLDSLFFKICRSARENIVSWHEVIGVGWDLFLKVYIPWFQAYPGMDSQPDTSISSPWRMVDKGLADGISKLIVDQLNSFVSSIPNDHSQGFLMHCTLIWIINGLLALKQLPSKPYHDTYCSSLNRLRWEVLTPSADCIKLILEFFSRSYNSDQSMALVIEVASKVAWSKVAVSSEETTNNALFKGLLFEMLVSMICRTKSSSIFKIQAMEPLTETLMEVSWNELSVLDYRKGMEQLAANLEPRVVLSNPSTIEGKVIRLLNQAAGQLTVTGPGFSTVMDRHAIYVNIVVKLLVVAFSFTSTKNSKGKQSEDSGQLKLFYVRVSTLFTEMETVTTQVKDESARNNLALSVLSEALVLFRNHAIAAHALDPVVGWIQESRSSPLLLPFLMAIYRWPPHVPSMVVLTNEIMEAYLLSDNSDASHGSWATVTSCARLSPELEQQYLRESVRNNCMLCLVQQVLLVLPSLNPSNSESWQHRIVDWLEETHPYSTVQEQGAILLIFLYLQMLLASSSANPKPGRSFDTMTQLLLKLSQSKKSSGLLGMVGMGKKSSFSFQFRMMCRSIMVFMQSQLPTNNLLRTRPHQPGAVTSQTMTVSSRPPGEPLPGNKTLQNLDWLKSQRQSKEMIASVRPVLEMSVAYICDPAHSIMDSVAFMRLLCKQLWPQEKLLQLVQSSSGG